MRCLITYQPSPVVYSPESLKRIHRNLSTLDDLPFSKEKLRLEAAARAEKMSIQGVQPKLSARLNISRGKFEIVDRGGPYILKPQSGDYPESPENEDPSFLSPGKKKDYARAITSRVERLFPES